eukprot:scaffold64587_cov26-Attheya_sp.AAC.1
MNTKNTDDHPDLVAVLVLASRVKDALILKSTLLSTVLANDGAVTPEMLLVYRPTLKRIHLMRQCSFGRYNSMEPGSEEVALPVPTGGISYPPQ